jgi:tetratricopeptide (TPR) repeat protein
VKPSALASACLLAAAATATRAADAPIEPDLDHFQLGTDALVLGRFEEAIDRLEAHADRAPAHPDASYNRGLAYLARVRAGAERTGDLGRAAAAFEEALLMRRGDPEAERALELCQAEIARRRARRGKDAVIARPPLDRALVGLAGERSWGIAAAASSAALAVGLGLRRFARGAAHLGGTVLAPLGAALLLAFVPLYHGARHLRLTTRPAVLVAETHLTDEAGVSQGGEPLPEGARLEVIERRGRLFEIRYGAVTGWAPSSAVRLLRTR